MRRLTNLLLLWGGLSATFFAPSPAGAGIGDDEYVPPDYSDFPPVKLQVFTSRGPLGVRFIQPTSKGVEIEMEDGVGSLSLQWDFMNEYRIMYPPSEAFEEALEAEDPAKRAKLLEPEARQLFPMLSLDPEQTNIHGVVRRYFDALRRAEDWEAAYEASKYVTLDRVPAVTARYFYPVVEELFREGLEKEGLELLGRLMAARPERETRRAASDIANTLAALRLFQPAYMLFVSMLEDSKGIDYKRIALECAFLQIEMGNIERANLHIQQAETIEQEDRETRAMANLILGLRALKTDASEEALDRLGESLAELKPFTRRKQIALYYNYQAYQNKGMGGVAQNIRGELELVYPEGGYTRLLEN